MGAKTRSAARLKRHQRVRRKLSGTADRPRLNVFRSLSEIYAQVINDDDGVTLAAASTIDRELRDELDGMSKSEQAKRVGQVVAERALEKGIKQVVFDRGGYQYIGRVKSLAEGARDGGLEF